MHISHPRSIILVAVVVTAVGGWAKSRQAVGSGTTSRVVGAAVVAAMMLLAVSEVAPQTAGALALLLMVGSLAVNGSFVATVLDGLSSGVTAPGTAPTSGAPAPSAGLVRRPPSAARPASAPKAAVPTAAQRNASDVINAWVNPAKVGFPPITYTFTHGVGYVLDQLAGVF